MGADDSWIDPLKLCIGDPEPLGLIAAQVIEGGIGSAHQRVQHPRRLRMLQVERQALLVAVEGLEEMAVTIAKEMRAHPTADVAPLGPVLDLDDMRTEVGQYLAAKGAGAILLNGDHGQA